MKKFLTMALSVLLISSCQKETNNLEIKENEKAVEIAFGAADAESKAFLDNTADGEAWEKKVTKITVYIVKTGGTNIIVERKFSAAEVAAMKAKFVVPNYETGATYEFWVLANHYFEPRNRTDLVNAIQSDVANYNSTFGTVTTAAARTGGFAMTGMATGVYDVANDRVNVSVPLTRLVSKHAIDMSTTTLFTETYKGTLRFDNIKVMQSSEQTPLFEKITLNAALRAFTFTQVTTTTASHGQNLFYIFENGDRTGTARVKFEINTTYDADKNFATVDDQQQIKYEIYLDGNALGKINRNSYFRHIIKIDGLEGKDVQATITVKDWATPITVNHNLGN